MRFNVFKAQDNGILIIDPGASTDVALALLLTRPDEQSWHAQVHFIACRPNMDRSTPFVMPRQPWQESI